MGQARVVEVLNEHGELSLKEMDDLIDDMSLPAIQQAIVNLSHWGLIDKRRVRTGGYGVYNKYRLKEGRGE